MLIVVVESSTCSFLLDLGIGGMSAILAILAILRYTGRKIQEVL